MTDPILAIALPLVSNADHMSDVLAVATEQGASAVVATDGTVFRAYGIEALRDAAARSASAGIGSVLDGATLQVLDTARAVGLGLDFSDLRREWVASALGQLGCDAMITSFGATPSGARFAYTLFDPAGSFMKIVSPVYLCPIDQKQYPRPGICPAHACPLVRKR